MEKAWESYLHSSCIQGLRNALPRERTTQKAHADMHNIRDLSLFKSEVRMYINTHQEDVLVAIRQFGVKVCEVLNTKDKRL